MSKKKSASEKKGDIFIVSAPSGAGKTTLCHALLKRIPKLRHSVSYTTRQPRKGEADKVHYHFVTKNRFMKMIENNEFAEWAMVHGNLYGTSIKKLEESNNQGYDIILDIDVQGAAQMRRKFKDALYIFILPPSGKALKERLSGRKSDSKEEINKRLERARDEMSSFNKYDYIIINDKLTDALKELESIVIASRLRTKRADLSRINKITK